MILCFVLAMIVGLFFGCLFGYVAYVAFDDDDFIGKKKEK